jgi:hypothetical protein
MTEFWLIVTLCAMSTLNVAPSGPHQPTLSSDCSEYRVDEPFPSIQACRLHQSYLKSLPLERHKVTASLCTAGLDQERIGELPSLSVALGDPA